VKGNLKMSIKKIISILLPIIIIISTVCLVPINAKEIELNTNTVVLKNNRKYKLKVKNTDDEVLWTSSNNKIAKVDSNGIISAIKNGTCYIKASINETIYKCKVTVKTATDITSTTVSNLKASKSNNKLILISASSTTSSTCKLQYYEKIDGLWLEKLNVTCYVGRNGINKKREGDKKTPTGLYHFSMLFGIKSNPGTLMKYTKLNKSMYWCGSLKKTYNQFIDDSKNKNHKKNCSHKSDEHLANYYPHYNYAAALDYNSNNIWKKGSAIFLHCKGSRKSTAGCIAVNESNMKYLIKKIDNKTAIIIDKKSNIKKY
jgi:L,D-peptidoglycan transpeptidase YkuD (ErfK/YbiS/YcfS/YnhG family)